MAKIGGELDLRRSGSPLPTERIEMALRSLPKGTLLRVVATDPGSVAHLERWSRRGGHRIVDQSEGGGEFVFLLDWGERF